MKKPCEGRYCRPFAGASEAEAPVGVEPTMADWQSAAAAVSGARDHDSHSRESSNRTTSSAQGDYSRSKNTDSLFSATNRSMSSMRALKRFAIRWVDALPRQICTTWGG